MRGRIYRPGHNNWQSKPQTNEVIADERDVQKSNLTMSDDTDREESESNPTSSESSEGSETVVGLPASFDLEIKAHPLPDMSEITETINIMENRRISHGIYLDGYDYGRNQPEFVQQNSLNVEIINGRIRVTGRCGKNYDMTVDDFEKLQKRINVEVRKHKISNLRTRTAMIREQWDQDMSRLNELEKEQKEYEASRLC